MPLMMPAAVTNFYPRPPHGGRLTITGRYWQTSEFLSTPSSRRATCAHGPVSFSPIFLSTPSARRATLAPESYSVAGPISIHALREEGDVIDGNNAVSYEISIHALREEGDTTPARPA